MAPHPPSDPEVTAWLTTLGITSRCQWDVLVFLARHQATLLGAAELARLLGYPRTTMVVAVEVLETQGLVTRSRVSQGARLYQCRVPLDAPRAEALARLQRLAADRVGRARVLQPLRRDHTPQEQLAAARQFLADAQQRLRVLRHHANIHQERTARWQQAR